VAFRIRWATQANRQVNSWQLSDVLLVEVHLRLQQLEQDPARLLVRLRQPFDGMCYRFSLVDPENRLREHRFLFHVVYSQDEERLIVVRGAYQRRDG
jgi:hypothetical protein